VLTLRFAPICGCRGHERQFETGNSCLRRWTTATADSLKVPHAEDDFKTAIVLEAKTARDSRTACPCVALSGFQYRDGGATSEVAWPTSRVEHNEQGRDANRWPQRSPSRGKTKSINPTFHSRLGAYRQAEAPAERSANG